MKSSPNVIYIHSHDTGRCIQPYGWGVPTPRFQQLAEEGCLFRQAFCANPTCSPSRAALLTGQWPHQCMLGLAHRGFPMADYSRHLAGYLNRQGYQTALSGIQHEIDRGVPEWWKVLGYEQYLNHQQELPHDGAIRFLRERDPAKPFFLSVGFGNTHRGFVDPGPDEIPAAYLPLPPGIADTPENRDDMRRFAASARQLDGWIGSVMDEVDRCGLRDHTIVICTTDHGIAFPRMKCTLYDGGIGILLMIRGPGVARGTVVDALASHVDLFPTLCEWLGIPEPEWLMGHSLMGLLHGGSTPVRDAVYAEVNWHAVYDPQRCVRTERWKYIRRLDAPREPRLSNIDDSPPKQLWLKAGYASMKLPSEELYDLWRDPLERVNLAGQEDHAGILAGLRDRLDHWMQATGDQPDPGALRPPMEARVNAIQAVSPTDPLQPALESYPYTDR